MNVIARVEYELAYYDSAVHRFNHYTTRTPHLHVEFGYIFDPKLIIRLKSLALSNQIGYSYPVDFLLGLYIYIYIYSWISLYVREILFLDILLYFLNAYVVKV